MPATATKHCPIDGYTVSERIGAGGYGEVWRADAPGGLSKAIKFVYGYLDDDRAARELKSLNLIKTVRHPMILSLERIEVVDGQLLIVTELADECLKDRFDRSRSDDECRIPRKELLIYMGDAADALDYMSETHSLQHLDVKPENLLLVGGRVKVADFGLVKAISQQTISIMGGMTPVYAPPEVFDGRPGLHSDQYSLAIVFQEMLTGQLPFPGRTAAQLAAQHLNSDPKLEALPEHDRAIIGRALSKNAADRFPSCREMIEALKIAPQSAGALGSPGSAAVGAGPTYENTERNRTKAVPADAISQAAESAACHTQDFDAAGAPEGVDSVEDLGELAWMPRRTTQY